MFQQLRNEPQFMNLYHRVVTARNSTNQPSSSMTATVAEQVTTIKNNRDIDNDESADKEKIVFVDLGSGDGRIVFHAAHKEQLFTNCIGYEINPFLHYYAILKQQCYKCRTIIFPQTRNHSTATTSTTTLPPPHNIGSVTTEFYLRDLWKVNLQNVNVVAVVRYLVRIVLHLPSCSVGQVY